MPTKNGRSFSWRTTWEFGATTIPDIYKNRRYIELFFKALKQNMKVKTFVGTTPYALYTRIWTALIAMLLPESLQFRSTSGWSLADPVAFPRWSLFTYRDLWKWLDETFETPPRPPGSVQKQLFLTGLGQRP